MSRPGEELGREPHPADALDGQPDREVAQVGAGRIDVGRVAEAELHVHGRRSADQLGHLVEADEAALVVRHLDVDVERRRAGAAELTQLLDGEIGGDVDRPRAELLERARRLGVRAGKEHRRLQHEVRRQVARALQLTEPREHADVGDQEGANPQRDAPLRFGDAPLHARGAAGDATHCGGRRRLPARVPRAARAEEERHFDATLGTELRHLGDLGVRQHHHPRPL